ncbi:class E sortase [Kitasatospora sp. KL5]|uniref:class E sortase n=1 Tax=Kitasatospora sp. KL5 TaxID=3425125 RepID=UPI003D6DBE51
MDQTPADTQPRRTRGRRRTNAAGNVMLAVALAAALFAAYSLWGTDFLANRHAERAGDRLRQAWASPGSGGDSAPARTGQEVGFLHVPAMRPDPVMIKVGTEPEVLDQGVAGVYQQPRAAMPWDKAGNFALAAHRDGHGAKFHDLDAVGVGAPIVVETRDHWYVYRVDGVLPETSPDNVGIAAPVPDGSPYREAGRYITLITCTPAYTSLYRMAVWGSLLRVDPVDGDRTPPAELQQAPPPRPSGPDSPPDATPAATDAASNPASSAASPAATAAAAAAFGRPGPGRQEAGPPTS